jgi:hypothetical protein
MPEALAVLAVFVVTVVAWVGAWLNARDPARLNGCDEIARLQHHADWLQHRLEMAQREKWSSEMIDAILADATVTAAQLSRASARDSESG